MRALLLLLTVTASLPAALADHDAGCVPGASSGIVVATPAVADAPGRYLIFELHPVGFFSVWVYEESNGLPGLQRGDEVQANEHCGHGADTIVF